MIVGIAPIGSAGILDNRITAPLKHQIDASNQSGPNKLAKVMDNGYLKKANGLNSLNGVASIDVTV